MPTTPKSIRRSSRSRTPPRRVRWRSRSTSGSGKRRETRKRRTESRSSSPSPPPPRGSRSPNRGRQSESRSPRNGVNRDDPLPSKVLGVFGMRWGMTFSYEWATQATYHNLNYLIIRCGNCTAAARNMATFVQIPFTVTPLVRGKVSQM